MKKIFAVLALVSMMVFFGSLVSRGQMIDRTIIFNSQGPCTPGINCNATVTPIQVITSGGSAPAPNGTPAPVSVTSFLGSTTSVQLQAGGLIVSGSNPLPVVIQTPLPTAQVQIYQNGPITVQFTATPQVQAYQSGQWQVNFTVTPQVQAYVQAWPTPGGIVSQGTPGPGVAAWPIFQVEPQGTPVAGKVGSATEPGAAMQIAGWGGAALNVPYVNALNGDLAGLSSTNAMLVNSAGWYFNGSNWNRARDVTGRVNATDGMGTGLVAETWASQGPVTAQATGKLATFSPQVTYRDITFQMNGIGGSGAVTASINSSLDGTNWVSIGVLTGAGNTINQATISEHYSPNWAVSILGLGASTTISSWIYAGE